MNAVLIVDDEAVVARAIRRLLSSQFTASVAYSAREALERIALGERFDAILSDIHMPDLDGMALYERVAVIAPDQCLGFIFMSGGHQSMELQTFLERNGRPCLAKPFSTTQLPELILQVIGARPHTAVLPAASL